MTIGPIVAGSIDATATPTDRPPTEYLSAATAFAPHVLREYALLADGERGILVGPRGDFVWMCAPRWDSSAVFSALIGGTGGYAVTPAHVRFVWGGHYEDRSLIWRSRWVTDTGIIECREALAFPGDPNTAVVLRRIVAVEGDAQVRVTLNARAEFGEHRMQQVSSRDGVVTARSGSLRLRWTGAGTTRTLADGTLETVIDVAEGRCHDLVLELADRPLPHASVDPAIAWRATEQAWEAAVPDFAGTLADRDTQHSYAVLRGMTSAGGGMVAAATMSLPERAEQGRNYDYRYSWIRDQCYAGQAIAAAGAYPLLDDAVAFVAARILDDGPTLKPAYTITGGAVPDEHTLNLPGYPGGSAKTGNWVNDQFQLDAFGEALLLFAAAGRLDCLDAEQWRAVEATVDAIEKRWGEPDAGIWELDNARWAHSRLACAAGLRAAAALAPARQNAEWNQMADMLVADTTRDCRHPSGRWQRSPEDPRVDAALLMPAIRGAVPADDPRTRATLEAVRTDLSDEGYVYRFRQDDRPLAESEGAFSLCGFLMALADHQQGNELAALRWFERNRAACGPPGLFTEEYDIGQRQLRGNLPQAFVHAVFFESAHRLTQPWPQP
ncbi:glycoside hydrolase family 15 protein [Antrihabitans cavernicola]|uniref:Glycoside hydrolase family 15 protein n=1 Tax=Antrihabitans cavernicola TaxID=2495913 RepID=A0A5A7S495_9NOCA|nr:glycoside hydrolase family 15 protein [Spelaeibacter cavernicola]KAA0016348.1 glycoside hydrolase family 15 protein [Spelaeibacter cavernicola]